MKENLRMHLETRNQLSEKDIATVIITYNGGDISQTIDILLKQTDHLIIVDNGSKESFKRQFRQYDNNRITIIENTENRGQAEALNQGWHIAEDMKYHMVLTMDQDSLIADNCVRLLIEGIRAGYDSVGPNYENKKCPDMFKQVKFLITSGNLITIDSLKKIGGFDEKLFIDSVDFDVSLRLRCAGYKLAIVRDARMKHYIGELKEDTGVFEHSVKRHYYIARNHYYTIYKYWMFDPIFCIKKQIAYLIDMRRVRYESEYTKKIEARIKGKMDARQLLQNSRRSIGD